jgi:hypothetical protein
MFHDNLLKIIKVYNISMKIKRNLLGADRHACIFTPLTPSVIIGINSTVRDCVYWIVTSGKTNLTLINNRQGQPKC